MSASPASTTSLPSTSSPPPGGLTPMGLRLAGRTLPLPPSSGSGAAADTTAGAADSGSLPSDPPPGLDSADLRLPGLLSAASVSRLEALGNFHELVGAAPSPWVGSSLSIPQLEQELGMLQDGAAELEGHADLQVSHTLLGRSGLVILHRPATEALRAANDRPSTLLELMAANREASSIYTELVSTFGRTDILSRVLATERCCASATRHVRTLARLVLLIHRQLPEAGLPPAPPSASHVGSTPMVPADLLDQARERFDVLLTRAVGRVEAVERELAAERELNRSRLAQLAEASALSTTRDQLSAAQAELSAMRQKLDASEAAVAVARADAERATNALVLSKREADNVKEFAQEAIDERDAAVAEGVEYRELLQELYAECDAVKLEALDAVHALHDSAGHPGEIADRWAQVFGTGSVDAPALKFLLQQTHDGLARVRGDYTVFVTPRRGHDVPTTTRPDLALSGVVATVDHPASVLCRVHEALRRSAGPSSAGSSSSGGTPSKKRPATEAPGPVGRAKKPRADQHESDAGPSDDAGDSSDEERKTDRDVDDEGGVGDDDDGWELSHVVPAPRKGASPSLGGRATGTEPVLPLAPVVQPAYESMPVLRSGEPYTSPRLRLASKCRLPVPQGQLPQSGRFTARSTQDLTNMSLEARCAAIFAEPDFEKALPTLHAELVKGHVRSSNCPLVLTDLALSDKFQLGVSTTLGWGSEWPLSDYFAYDRAQPIHCQATRFWLRWPDGNAKPIRFQTQPSVTQTAYYPNYGVIQVGSRDVFAAYGARGWLHYDALVGARMWDDMWASRVTRLYLLNPAALTDASWMWVLQRIQFGFVARQAFWEHSFWLHTAKLGKASAPRLDMANEWSVRLKRRDALAGAFELANEAMMAGQPACWPPHFDELLNDEPAIWSRPRRHCAFAPCGSAFDIWPIQEQARYCADEEPIRLQWTTHPRRFVEALWPSSLLALFFHHQAGASWQLPGPSPWDRADSRTMFLCTPGPDFYKPGFSGFEAWKVRFEQLRSAVTTYRVTLARGDTVGVTRALEQARAAPSRLGCHKQRLARPASTGSTPEGLASLSPDQRTACQHFGLS